MQAPKGPEMSPRIAIVTDSTSDLTPDAQNQFGITVVPLNVHFGKETYRDRVDLSAGEFMEKLSSAATLPTTSQPAVRDFEVAFRALAETHDEILCILHSSKLSGTLQSATVAAKSVTDLIPVEIVDSQNVSYGLALQAMRAARLARTANSAASIADILNAEIGAYYVVFFVETLDHMRRGGQVGKAAQLLGTVLQLRPLLRIEEGQVVPFERTRTRARAIAALAEFVRELGGIEEAAVIYNTTPEDAQGLATEVETILDNGFVPVVQLGPVLSTHVGPGVLGVVVKVSSND
jgi:DegV family protein with EDD domain